MSGAVTAPNHTIRRGVCKAGRSLHLRGGARHGTIVHYADYIANDFASILMGVEPVHSAMRMVPKDPSYGSAAS